MMNLYLLQKLEDLKTVDKQYNIQHQYQNQLNNKWFHYDELETLQTLLLTRYNKLLSLPRISVSFVDKLDKI